MRFHLLLCTLTLLTSSTLARPNFLKCVLDFVHAAAEYTKTKYPRVSSCAKLFERAVSQQILYLSNELSFLVRDRLLYATIKKYLLHFKQCIVKRNVDYVDQVVEEFNNRLWFSRDCTEL
ncbi:hypothetical protein BIW11_08367 [Tropilaelaps mercedesae]|uniref:Uncharacterized protein n=1 Tax=Tropilaelaps mercedesae TaxID=418985 RepID=A0A1V9XPV1_9ACAR|nr:hypothetical protein BIW11_08367 [Tropilaelaps mercedesae]